MYSYDWDPETKGIILTTKNNSYVSHEIRPVFAKELDLSEIGNRFDYDSTETRPLMWAQRNVYYYDGQKVAQLTNTQLGKKLNIDYYFDEIIKLEPVNVKLMVEKNQPILDVLVADTKRRTKELYDKDIKRCDTAYIAFSGGKDSVVLLDICNQVLPASVPVIFSDTDMELPDTYDVWEKVQKKYTNREFIKSAAEVSALKNWELFGPPSHGIRWCCSIHKSTPALITLKNKYHCNSIKIMAFVGVRGEESYSRSFYEDNSDGVKNASQLNRMPLIDWGAHEIWLYLFKNHLDVNEAYFKGLPRVGCVLCPESSCRYEWFVEHAYPGILNPYNKIILETTSKKFKNEQDRNDYIANLGWQARKSGTVLKNPLYNPFEKREGTKSIFQIQNCSESMFFEWIKTIGDIFKSQNDEYFLKIPKYPDLIKFDYESTIDNFVTITIEYNNVEEQKELFLLIRSVIRKSVACIGCRSCEANCIFGAISFKNGDLKINEKICTKCHKCHEIEQNCWRFRSMYRPDSDMNKMNSINNYSNFGLREKDNYLWISTLVDMGKDFFPWNSEHPLGNKMVSSASKWFKQALLIDDKTKEPTALLEVFRKFGGNSKIGWELIWTALANNALLIKWYIVSTELGKTYSIEQLGKMLSDYDSTLSNSAINGGLSAFKDMITKSPIGNNGDYVETTLKGRSVIDVTRVPKEISSLTILYGLYLIGKLSDRSSFSIRDLMNADMDSKFVSPLIIFGIPPESFIKQCEGLRTKYPEYISTTFTHGNDGIEIHADQYDLSDIIKLILEE